MVKKTGTVRFFFPGFLIALLFSFYFVVINSAESQTTQREFPEETFLAPSFELPSLNGGKVKLEDLRGKVVFINFWATWCVACLIEMPSMEKLYQRFKDRDFEMFAISVDKDVSLIKPFLDKYNLTFPVLLDPKSEVAKNKYKTIMFPETFVVDKEGIIRHKSIGPRNWSSKEMIGAFDHLVNVE
ncbi:MAG: peroxiredoxin family protein [Nitrospinales bacterium]